ncbi:putative ribonuclease H-like domain-containing protein [Tanacetum coccineum]
MVTHLPAASMSVFDIVSVLMCTLTYRRVLVPLAERLSGNPKGLTELQRMGVGLIIGLFAMVVAGLTKVERLKSWNFFNSIAPDGIKSFGSSLCMASISLGNYVSSLLVHMVMSITVKGGEVGWIPENLNDGHMEQFYFLIAPKFRNYWYKIVVKMFLFIKDVDDTNCFVLGLIVKDKQYPFPFPNIVFRLVLGLKDFIEFLLLRIDQGLGSTSGIRACALRNFDLEVIEFKSTQNNTTAKLPILKLGEYEMWVIRIKQYFQTSVPATAEEKTNKKNYGNETTKKTQKTLLKQQYENFNASSIESLDSIFNMLQKIVSRLAILGVVITQEDLNSKFLRSLPLEWNTHVVVWMNKTDIKTMSIDDLYNNFKIVEQDIKKSVGASTGAQNMAFMTAPSTNGTNDVSTANPVSTVSPNVNTASPQVSTDNLSDNAVYAFMVENPNGSNILQQDLEYFQRTDKKIFINANDTVGYDKSKVECFNCHKMGHFAREYRASRNQDGRFRNQDNTRKQGNNEDTYSKAMLAINGIGFDWSDMAEEQFQTNMALMAFSDSKNEVLFSEEVAVLKREVACKDYEISVLKTEFEKVKQEKEEPKFKGYGPKDSKQESNIVCDNKSYDSKENYVNSFVNKQVSEETSSFAESPLNVDKETVFPADKKIEPRVVNTARPHMATINTIRANRVNAVKALACWVWKPTRPNGASLVLRDITALMHEADPRFIDSGCSWYMTGNIAYLLDFKEFDEGYVTFGGGAYGGRISGKSTLKTNSLDFEDVYFVNELQFNLFSILQMCDKKNYVLFTDTECLVLSSNFKLPDESQILLKIPRKDNMYSFDMKNIVPKESLTCLVANPTLDESMLWDRRLGHINFKNINKLVKDNLVRGLPTKRFENEQTCVACHKGSNTELLNGVAERRNRTLIEAARTMLADFKLPTTF